MAGGKRAHGRDTFNGGITVEQRIRNYVNELFKNAPKTPRAEDVKNEIIGNTLEKYGELRAGGMDEETAFATAISYIGNVDALINEYSKDEDAQRLEGEERKYDNIRAILLSVSVALYILSVVPVILFNGSSLAVCMMFAMIAVATGIIIYRANMKRPHWNSRSDARDSEQPSAERKSEKSSVSGALWAIVVLVYLLVSFLTGGWHITWIIFLIGVAVDNIITAVFDYNGNSADADSAHKGEKK